MEKKNINAELWQACAGPLVNLPVAGTHVVYFPQGHSEQVYPSLSLSLYLYGMCQVLIRCVTVANVRGCGSIYIAVRPPLLLVSVADSLHNLFTCKDSMIFLIYYLFYLFLGYF